MLWGGVPTLFIGIDPSLGYLHSLRPLALSLVFYVILTPGIILDLVIKCSSKILPGPPTIWTLFLLSFSNFFIWATLWAFSPAGTVLLLFQTLKFSFLTNTSSLPHSLCPYSHRTFLTSSTLSVPSLFFLISALCCFYGLSHSINHFPPPVNPASHFILPPVSLIPSYSPAAALPIPKPRWTLASVFSCPVPRLPSSTWENNITIEIISMTRLWFLTTAESSTAAH